MPYTETSATERNAVKYFLHVGSGPKNPNKIPKPYQKGASGTKYA